MLYIKIKEDQTLAYECRKCGSVMDADQTDIDNCIYSKNYKTNEISYSWMIHPDLCEDPTLPRVSNIPCPNDEIDENTGKVVCPTKSKTNRVSNEVIYVLYDNMNMKYFYMCCHCHTTWKQE